MWIGEGILWGGEVEVVGVEFWWLRGEERVGLLLILLRFLVFRMLVVGIIGVELLNKRVGIGCR